MKRIIILLVSAFLTGITGCAVCVGKESNGIENSLNMLNPMPTSEIIGLNNGLSIAKSGEWLYYYCYNDIGICKIKENGTDKENIYDIGSDANFTISNFNVVGDWIYYRDATDWDGADYTGAHFDRVKTDGSGWERLINNARISCLQIVGDWIYFSEYNPKGWTYTLYRMKTDGTGREIITEVLQRVFIDGDWIYYNNPNDSKSLYRIRTDGTDETKLYDKYTWIIAVKDGWVYYRDESSSLPLFAKTQVDGDDMSKLPEVRNVSDNPKDYHYISNINVAGDWIYYSDGVDALASVYGIHRINIDGSGRTTLTDDVLVSALYINIIGDWIYYIYAGEHVGLYKIRTDGSERQPIEIFMYSPKNKLFGRTNPPVPAEAGYNLKFYMKNSFKS